jgi:diguanylate cyclase (GGDEF)-like protein/PAS domain S-box-containing protein
VLTLPPSPQTPIQISSDSLLDVAPVALFAVDRDGLVRQWNEASEQLFATSAREAIGRPHPFAEAPGFGERFSRMLDGESLEALEIEQTLADGRQVVFSCSGRPMRAADGEVSGVLLCAQDVTTRRAAERALTESNAQLQAQVDALPLGVVVSTTTGKILTVNERFRELWRVPADLAPAADEDALVAHMGAQIADRDAWMHDVRRSTDEAEFEGNAEIPLRDGRVLERFAALFRYDDGRVGGRILTYRDITSRIRSERTIAEQQEFLSAVLDGASHAIFWTDRHGAIIGFNRGAERMLGWSGAELVERGGMPPFFVGDELEARAKEISIEINRSVSPDMDTVTARAELGLTDERDWTFVRQDGEQIPVRMSVTTVRTGNGELRGFLGIAHEVGEQRRAERAVREAHGKLQGYVHDLERRSQKARLVSEMSDMLQSCQTAAEVRSVIDEYAPHLFPFDSGAVSVINASRTMVEAVSTWGAQQSRDRVFSPVDCWALRRGQIHMLRPGRPGICCPHAHEDEGAALICVPMMAQGEALGMLHLSINLAARGESGVNEEEMLEEVRQRAAHVAEQIALALANFQLRDRLRAQSLRDPLTSLFNRRYLEESFEREVRRAQRNGRPMSLIVFDVDHFKRFNDTHGHDGGDAVLRSLGQTFAGIARGDDIACRWGGEEFVWLLPDCSLEMAAARADDLRRRVEALAVENGGRSLGTVTISLGVASHPTHGKTLDTLFALADRALYRAKHEGRNCVRVPELAGDSEAP